MEPACSNLSLDNAFSSTPATLRPARCTSSPSHFRNTTHHALHYGANIDASKNQDKHPWAPSEDPRRHQRRAHFFLPFVRFAFFRFFCIVGDGGGMLSSSTAVVASTTVESAAASDTTSTVTGSSGESNGLAPRRSARVGAIAAPGGLIVTLVPVESSVLVTTSPNLRPKPLDVFGGSIATADAVAVAISGVPTDLRMSTV